MKIKFSSDILKIEFGDNDSYSGRSLSINGEALYDGFEADESTMRWLAPFTNEVVTPSDRAEIRKLILAENQNSDFVIWFAGH